MIRRTFLLLAAALLLIPAAAAQDDMMGEGTAFTVTIENVSGPASTAEVFNTPTDASEPGPALPGSAYSFSFSAQPGEYLSFTTMLVQSNDLFFAPQDYGIALFDDMGAPVTGDITEAVLLWDAGTEANEEPGVGENQAPRQSGPDTGDDEMGVVTTIDKAMDGFSYPAVNELIRATLDHDGETFTLTIDNISGDSALPTPLAPGVFAVHYPAPYLFTSEAPASAGIEAMAEDGNAATLLEEAQAERLVVPLSPGLFAVHTSDVLFFETGTQASAGLEAIAEDGSPAELAAEFDGVMGIHSAGIFNTPHGSMEAGPAFPGQDYRLHFEAQPGDYLSFATMFVQSNDLFYAPEPTGIALFDDMGSPVTGEVTALVLLWDAGSEVNEEPGVGENQAPRQSGPDTGEDEMGTISTIEDAMDEFSYPPVAQVIRVTIQLDDDMSMGG